MAVTAVGSPAPSAGEVIVPFSTSGWDYQYYDGLKVYDSYYEPDGTARGSGTGATPFTRTDWPEGGSVSISRSLTIPSGGGTLRVLTYVDDAVTIYLDGVHVADSGFSLHGTSYEGPYPIPVTGGGHLLRVDGFDSGGGDAYLDVEVRFIA
jgi:hypothetical protein